MFIAAGTFLVAKNTTQYFTTIQLSWCRIVLSFLIVLPIYRCWRPPNVKITRGDLFQFALLGLMGVTCNQMLFLHGISLAPVLDGALLYAFTPAMVLIAAVLWLGERLTWLKAGGAAIALCGVLIVLKARGLDVSTEFLEGDLFILLAVVAWAGYTLLGKSVLRRHGTLTVITWAFGFGAASMVPLTPWVLGGLDFAVPGWSGWCGVLYLSGMTSGIAFTLWYWALKRLEASRVAIFTNLQPFLTALLAWKFFGDVPTWQVIGGGLLVLTGVTLAQLPTKRPDN